MVFCKSAKRYFDLDAVREPYADPTRYGKDQGYRKEPDYAGTDVKSAWTNKPGFILQDRGGAPPLDWWNIPLTERRQSLAAALDPAARSYGWLKVLEDAARERLVQLSDDDKPGSNAGGKLGRLPCKHGMYDGHVPTDHREPKWCEGGEFITDSTAPLDWWNIPPGGYEGAHYAVFPPELCIKPIKAMCPERVCRQCEKPSERISEVDGLGGRDFKAARTGVNDRDTGLHGPRLPMPTITRTTLGFSDCGHNNWRPGVVLDPFGGSGTTALVATGHGRDCILIDLDERNYELALQRVGPFILSRVP